MATIKSYTDIEQSRKLAEFLPLESSDGFWEYHNIWDSQEDEWEGYKDYPRAEPYLKYYREENEWKEDKSNIPCWSLAALLGVLPKIQGSKPMIDLNDNYITYPHMSDLHTKADNLVDACYEMIIKLHELNLL